MDDTPRRVKNEAEDAAMRRPADEFRGQSDEQATSAASSSDVRNYSASAAVGASPAEPASTDSSTDDADLDRRTSQIRGEIEHTREEMTETIDAIQEKLRPSNIVANATERVKQATTERVRGMADMASDTASEMMDYGRDAYGTVASEVRQNPIPIAMIGIGAAWLLMNQGTSSHRGQAVGRRGYRGSPYRGAGWQGNMWRPEDRGRYRAPARTDDYGQTAAGSWSDEEFERGSGVMDAISRNPIPTALTAMGVAWLAFSRSGHDDVPDQGRDRWAQQADEDAWRRQYRGAQRQGIGWTGTNTGSGGSDYEGSARASSSSTSTSSLAEGAMSSAQQYASRAQDYAGGIASRARDYAGDVGERASEYADRAQDYAGEALETVQRRGRQAQNELQRMMHENPLLVGAGALALGAVVGMALPETDTENEWMGETRDTVIDRAQDMAREAASKAQEAAGDMVGEIASRVVTGDPSHQA